MSHDPIAMGMELPLDGTHIRKVSSVISQRRWRKDSKKAMNPWNTAPEPFQGWCMSDHRPQVCQKERIYKQWTVMGRKLS
jgi:hypothetical protein